MINKRPSHNFKSLVGRRFVRLTVIKRVSNNKHKKACWLCLCDCGQFKIIPTGALTTGNTKSCGCLNEELRRVRPLGKKHAEESKRKMSLSQKNRPPASIETRNKISAAGIGRKQSPETRRKRSLSLLGIKRSPETILKMSIAATNISDETREKMRAAALKKKIKFKDTSIEISIEKELQKRGVVYKKQVPLAGVALVDFYLPEQKKIIQADGCYWHGCPIHNPKWIQRRERDVQQDKKLEAAGYTVYRFWGHEIEESSSRCINTVLGQVNPIDKNFGTR